MRKGFSLIEMIIYVAIVALVLLVIVNMVIVITRSNREFRASRNIQNAAITSLERITRDVQDSKAVNSAGSSLSLDVEDSEENTKTIEFVLIDGAIHVLEDSTDLGPITSSSVLVTDLNFYLSSNASSTQIIRTEMSLKANIGSIQKTEDFQTSAVVKGSL